MVSSPKIDLLKILLFVFFFITFLSFCPLNWQSSASISLFFFLNPTFVSHQCSSDKFANSRLEPKEVLRGFVYLIMSVVLFLSSLPFKLNKTQQRHSVSTWFIWWRTWFLKYMLFILLLENFPYWIKLKSWTTFTTTLPNF